MWYGNFEKVLNNKRRTVHKLSKKHTHHYVEILENFLFIYDENDKHVM